MTTPQQMTAVIVEGAKGPASALRTAQIETPRPQTGQILIRVRAAGINRPDVLQRMGLYPPPPGAPDTLGLEVAGEVAEVGEGAPRWKVGEKVVALLGGGGYAGYAAIDGRQALPLPRGLDFVQAASLPETVFTVWANVFEAGELKAGETLLVHGATSGIGVAAIQMAKAAGARVIATSRGAAKAAQALSLGADVAIHAGADDFAQVVRAEGGADVVLDMVGGAYVGKDIDAAKPGGRIVMIAAQGGSNADVNILKVMQKRLVLTGSTLRPRGADEKARLAAVIEKTVWPWIEAGKVKAVVDQSFPLAQAAAAHARLESDAHLGKIVLTL